MYICYFLFIFLMKANIFYLSQIYLEDRCIRVVPGDRLGVYVEEMYCSVAYTLNMWEYNNRTQRSIYAPSTPKRPGETLAFYTSSLNNALSLAAFVDTS